MVLDNSKKITPVILGDGLIVSQFDHENYLDWIEKYKPEYASFYLDGADFYWESNEPEKAIETYHRMLEYSNDWVNDISPDYAMWIMETILWEEENREQRLFFIENFFNYAQSELKLEILERCFSAKGNTKFKDRVDFEERKRLEDARLKKALHEKEKEMLSFFTHTMRNALATAPESLREVIRLLGSDDYEKNIKHYKAINKIVTLFSTLSLTDCLIDTFKQSISDQKEFKQSWQKDCDGDATPKWVIASALRQSLNRIIFMSDTDKLKMLLNNKETEVVKSTRKSFIDNVLPLDVDAQGITAFYDWVGCINLIEIVIDENSTPHFGTNQVKFSLLFSITSELILNAFKYWSGVSRIQISWQLDEDYYIFTVKNPCEANASSNLAGTHKGVAFIKRLMELLGEQAKFYCAQEEQSFVAELKLHKTLLEG
jgi:hypothetical protein